MPFLLLLSAILTALTGAVTGVRPADVQIARQAQAASVQRVATAAARVASGHTHLLGEFGVAVTFATAAKVVAHVVAAPRLYLDRPRA